MNIYHLKTNCKSSIQMLFQFFYRYVEAEGFVIKAEPVPVKISVLLVPGAIC